MFNRTNNKIQALISFILVVASILSTISVMEITLRLAGYNPLINIHNGQENIIRLSSVPERGYEAIPNASGQVGKQHIKINSYGFRDKEYNLHKEKGTYRIAIIGDSITYAAYFPLEDIYTELLEDLFAEKRKKVEVMNLALSGYDTLAEVSTLEQIGIPFQPDLVVVGYCVNDILSSSNLSNIMNVERYRSPIYRLRLVQFISSKIDILRGRSKVKEMNQEEQFVSDNKDYIADISDDHELNRIINSLKKQKKEKGFGSYLVNMYLSEDHLGKLRYSLERLKKLENKYGFNVVVMIISTVWKDETYNDINKTMYSIVEHEASRLGFEVISTYKTFQSAGFKNLMRNESDGIHPNQLGHKLMADLLYEHISSNFNLERTN